MSPKKKRPLTSFGAEVDKLRQFADDALAESNDPDQSIEERQLLALQSVGYSLLALVHIGTRGDLL